MRPSCRGRSFDRNRRCHGCRPRAPLPALRAPFRYDRNTGLDPISALDTGLNRTRTQGYGRGARCGVPNVAGETSGEKTGYACVCTRTLVHSSHHRRCDGSTADRAGAHGGHRDRICAAGHRGAEPHAVRGVAVARQRQLRATRVRLGCDHRRREPRAGVVHDGDGQPDRALALSGQSAKLSGGAGVAVRRAQRHPGEHALSGRGDDAGSDAVLVAQAPRSRRQRHHARDDRRSRRHSGERQRIAHRRHGRLGNPHRLVHGARGSDDDAIRLPGGQQRDRQRVGGQPARRHRLRHRAVSHLDQDGREPDPRRRLGRDRRHAALHGHHAQRRRQPGAAVGLDRCAARRRRLRARFAAHRERPRSGRAHRCHGR